MVRNDGIKKLLIILFVTIFYDLKFSNAAGSEPVFSEGGDGVPYALEEEILEELAKNQQQQGQSSEENFGGISNVAKPQNQPKIEHEIPKPPKQQPSPPPPQQQQQQMPQQKPAENNAAVDPSMMKSQYDQLKSAAAAAIMKQTSNILGQQKPPKQKKEGQEEFATFVDPFSQPAQNRRLSQPKQVHGGHYHEEKRAPVNSGKADGDDLGDTVFIAVVAVCSAFGVLGFSVAGYTFYSLHKQYKAAQDVEYPHYGVTGPAKERTSGSTSPVAAMDAKLASSAQLYHYQHTKQQIIAMEHSNSDPKGQESEDSEGEGDEGDYSVYECPGLAPTGDIEVSNPLFENVASPQTKVDPRKETETEFPRVHQRSPVRGEDP